MADKEPLTPEDIERLHELEEITLPPLVREMEALRARFKNELPEGDYPTKNGYLVKRWNQIGALIPEVFANAYDPEKAPEFFLDSFTDDVAKYIPTVDDRPDLYEKKPDIPAIKELLSKEDKKVYFKQTPYLKIEKKA